MPDDGDAGEDPIVAVQRIREVALDLDRVGGAAEAQALREAFDVRVHHHAAGNAEGFAQHDVGSLARHAAEAQKLGHGAGDFAVEFVQQLGGGLANGAGLAAEEAGLANDFFNFELGGGGQGLGRGVAAEEFRRDPVDGDVGGLGGQDDGDEELEWVLVVQFGRGFRV